MNFFKDLIESEGVVDEGDDINATNEVALFYNKEKDKLMGDKTPDYLAMGKCIELLHLNQDPVGELIEETVARDLLNQSQINKRNRDATAARKKKAANQKVAWQKEADELTATREPKQRYWKKIDYANRIRDNLGCEHEATYIARHIKVPKYNRSGK